MPKLIFFVTEDWYFVSHRLALAIEAIHQGYEVAVVTRVSDCRSVIEQAGIRVIPFEVNRRGLNPVDVLNESISLAAVYRRESPDIVHHVALRPVVVGGLAARLAGVTRVVSAITGMGFLFTDGGRRPLVSAIVRKVLPYLVSRGLVIVQNTEDARLLSLFGVPVDRQRLIPGVGVDAGEYRREYPGNEIPVVMLAARILWDKGVGEFVEAAQLLRDVGARFVLVGKIDASNPAAVAESQVDAWVSDGIVEWWGHQTDMSATLSKADIFCLPSYREGLPKGLLEAMAAELPCVSTDVPGCRDVVRDGHTGFLVPAKNARALAAAIYKLIQDPELRQTMGRAGRKVVVQEFSQTKMIAETIKVYREMERSACKQV